LVFDLWVRRASNEWDGTDDRKEGRVHESWQTLMGVVAIGAAVGFLSGLFGKGGSAIATPMLHAIGIPAIVAVASPLPATIPSTLAATSVYWKQHLVDAPTARWSIGIGIPATIAGAYATRWVGGDALVAITDVIIVGLGLRFALAPGDPHEVALEPERFAVRAAAVALVVGILAGLLANSGGFLLAPLYVLVLRAPIKQAFATSLLVSAALAVPGTIVHAALGHIDWTFVVVFGAASIPLSFLGARVALRTQAVKLERIYGFALVLLGTVFLVVAAA
jgi:uncharacterized membrane protein YfcA